MIADLEAKNAENEKIME